MQPYEELYKFVEQLTIIDTHEHLPLREDLRDRDADVLKEYLSHYISSDLISAGLSQADYQRVTDTALPLLERWEILEPYWACAQFTGYARALKIAVQDLYGIRRCRVLRPQGRRISKKRGRTIRRSSALFPFALYFRSIVRKLLRLPEQRFGVLDGRHGGHQQEPP